MDTCNSYWILNNTIMNRLIELIETGKILGRREDGYWTVYIHESVLSNEEKEKIYNIPDPPLSRDELRRIVNSNFPKKE